MYILSPPMQGGLADVHYRYCGLEGTRVESLRPVEHIIWPCLAPLIEYAPSQRTAKPVAGSMKWGPDAAQPSESNFRFLAVVHVSDNHL